MATKAVTIRLDPGDYERLEAEARQAGVSPSALVRDYVRSALSKNPPSDPEQRRQALLSALEGLRELRERLPDLGPVDVVEIINQGRREREQAMLEALESWR